jgi:sulfite reductase alpha subunit-like flavoprotein
VQTQLLAAGADRLIELGSADAEEANFVEAIDDWTAQVIPVLLKKFKVRRSMKSTVGWVSVPCNTSFDCLWLHNRQLVFYLMCGC